jgi:hypothetical protein
MNSTPNTQLIVVPAGRLPRGTVGSIPLELLKKFNRKPLRRPPKRKKQK